MKQRNRTISLSRARRHSVLKQTILAVSIRGPPHSLSLSSTLSLSLPLNPIPCYDYLLCDTAQANLGFFLFLSFIIIIMIWVALCHLLVKLNSYFSFTPMMLIFFFTSSILFLPILHFGYLFCFLDLLNSNFRFFMLGLVRSAVRLN